MVSWVRCALIFVTVLAASLSGDRGTACELCRRYSNTTAVQIGGGDAFDDALHVVDLAEGSAGSAGFTTVGSKWPQPGGKGTPVYLTYSYQNMFDGGLLMPNGQPLPALLIKRSIEEALRLWSSVAPLHFTEVEDNGLPYGNPAATYGTIRFRHVYINGPDPAPPASPIAKAQAYYPNTFNVLGGDVEYDHGDRWQESGELPRPDILGATIHELGHSLGLGHSDLPASNMYWIFTRYTGLGQGKLHADDIAGIQFIYGAGVGSLTTLAMHAPEPASWMLVVFALVVASLAGRSFLGRPGSAK